MEGPAAFWEVQEAMNIDYLDEEVPAWIVH